MLDNQSKTIARESYQLNIDPEKIVINAMTNSGVMHGIQTLRQLFVDEFHQKEKRSNWYLPCLKINDAPVFSHRGLLLDCSRHFFDKKTVKKYIDLLALYKMNVLHWHLTEDQGWRIAIDSYPKLTEVGGWRIEENGEKYGGFYTKEDIKEIVAYAKQREVTIIPEIELPGHSQAAISSYPYLSCTGEQVDVANDWGVFKEIYCAGNDSVFIFLENVLKEVMDLFPSKYIHIGGDEAPKYRWEQCPKCQKRIKDEKLKNEHELQSYFISRIEKFLNNNGRELIGWDEILEGGLSPNATVQSWRGMEGGILAANSEHNAIMSPTSHAYFDYSLKSIDLEKVYAFDPIPKDLSKDKHKFILGGECNMWTEHVLDESALDSKVFPRLLAMSEVLWSYPEKRSYDSFYQRVQSHYPMLKGLTVNYGEETISASITSKVVGNKAIIKVEKGSPDLVLKYKWNNSQKEFLLYEDSITLDNEELLIVQAYKNNLPYGDSIVQKFNEHKALGAHIKYFSNYSDWYTAGGDKALVDGRIGSLDFRDGCWQGTWGGNINVFIDLGKVQNISHVAAHFYQYNNSWIFLPEKVIFEGSVDGKKYFDLAILHPKTKPEDRGKFIEEFKVNFEKRAIRFIGLRAKNIKTVPAWHEAAGSEAWLFIDEIVVK